MNQGQKPPTVSPRYKSLPTINPLQISHSDKYSLGQFPPVTICPPKQKQNQRLGFFRIGGPKSKQVFFSFRTAYLAIVSSIFSMHQNTFFFSKVKKFDIFWVKKSDSVLGSLLSGGLFAWGLLSGFLSRCLLSGGIFFLGFSPVTLFIGILYPRSYYMHNICWTIYEWGIIYGDLLISSVTIVDV